ncbi:hypothetical protein P7C73_g795, partial [Tremellales sp. Uapishka_1]
MPDTAQINRSLGTIRTELEFLRDSGALGPQQFQSIVAQLPMDGKQSQYVDPRYSGEQAPPFQQIAQDAQNPNNPAHPSNARHHEWASNMAGKFGNAMMWGAGATFGGDMVNDALKHV